MVQMMLQKAEVGLVIQIEDVENVMEKEKLWWKGGGWASGASKSFLAPVAPRLGSLALRTPLTAVSAFVSATRRESKTLRVLEYALIYSSSGDGLKTVIYTLLQ